MTDSVHAIGKSEQPGYRKLVVRVEQELWDVIRDRAEEGRTTITEQIRILLEWGLEAATEDQ